jgi:hypothetical protein
MRPILFAMPPRPPTPPPAPVDGRLLTAIERIADQPALYVMAHADRSAVKIGAVERGTNATRRLQDVARHHARRLAHHCPGWTGALPLELLALVAVDNPSGDAIWPDDRTGLLGIEHRVRDIVSRQVGPPAPWWEWVLVRREVQDDQWQRLLANGVRTARRELASPPEDPLGLFALVG